ncbi:MAG: queuosine precursor transporter [Litoreibacter sp.]|nr:queuosine precursor transporter [Litoreibacter sp.]
MTRILPGIAAMAAVVVASNILVQFLLGNWLTWGAFTYPIAFLVTDVMNRVYGPSAARKVVFAGFVVGIICSLIGSQIMIEFAPGVSGPAVALRVAIGSAIAFLTAQLLDVAIFDRLRGGEWWKAPLTSTLIGSAVDTALFFTIAFSASIAVFGTAADAEISWAWEAVPFLGVGAAVPLWASLAVADWGVKLAIALIALVPFRIIVAKLSPSVT